FRIMPTQENNAYLQSRVSSPIYEAVLLSDLLKRPEINKQDILFFTQKHYNDDALEQLEIKIKYEGYIHKAMREVEKMLRLEDKIIPNQIDYMRIKNISSEGKEKLTKVRPQTLGQATRISGVNPADVSVLLIYLESGSMNHDL
ncbi:MAG: tRNA uridine-5-carboxymethylaminomethyl(34) synthesis enzyme MnmG, partial [Firmicutes bacterium]|nr:tRNA uridine-5-carboxymethylaminomethyl(34) synthesis enzyme MnmG [Bacillota bacterium]